MRRVVKVGGSLLLRKDLPEALNAWFEEQKPAENIVMVGGGELIDAIRRLDELRPSSPTDVHWRCVKLLRTTYCILCDWFPEWEHVDRCEVFSRGVNFGFSCSKPTLLDVNCFYKRGDGADLPVDWRTTTDSIAALLGVRASANEVVLLKSCDVDRTLNVNQLATAGIVDEALPIIASEAPSLRVERLP